MELVTSDNPILRQVSKYVKSTEFGTIALTDLVDKLYEVLERKEGIGISAVQVGVLKRICIVGDSDGSFTVMFNPTILVEYGSQKCIEGCLSFPGLTVEVERPTRVNVEYQDILGQRQVLKSRDRLLSQCIVHELLHLEGIVLPDMGKDSG